MAYDAVKMADWQISEAAEPNMPTPDEWREKLSRTNRTGNTSR
jgi:formate--tetrahydrofolate ligase